MILIFIYKKKIIDYIHQAKKISIEKNIYFIKTYKPTFGPKLFTP